ncbi:hypothetical protein C8R45DRAFT_1031929 [Mycena sanguinolenta]|nr:hypothetical protein C8R45DRAFT_1031929 [Mycena sanguinolenta]
MASSSGFLHGAVPLLSPSSLHPLHSPCSRFHHHCAPRRTRYSSLLRSPLEPPLDTGLALQHYDVFKPSQIIRRYSDERHVTLHALFLSTGAYSAYSCFLPEAFSWLAHLICEPQELADTFCTQNHFLVEKRMLVLWRTRHPDALTSYVLFPDFALVCGTRGLRCFQAQQHRARWIHPLTAQSDKTVAAEQYTQSY